MQKSPQKNCPLMVENAWEQRMFIIIEKKWHAIKNTPCYIHYADAKKKVLFIKRLRIDLIFPRLRTFSLLFYFLGLFWHLMYHPVLPYIVCICTVVDGKQQHARQIRIIGRLGFWWGMSIIPRQFFPEGRTTHKQQSNPVSEIR